MFDQLSEKFTNAFKVIQGKNKISEENIEETLKQIRTALLESDVNFKVVKDFVNSVKEKAIGEKVLQGVSPGEQFVKIVYDELAKIMGEKHEEMNFNRTSSSAGGPVFPVLVVGLNGAGKTTFSAKLAFHLTHKLKKKVLLVPADTFRPAAKDQLQTLAKSSGLNFYDSDLSLGPEVIAKKAMAEAKNLGMDVVIIDTAGRLHVDTDLMDQIKNVKLSIKEFLPEVLMVSDVMTGQEAVNVSKAFNEAVGLTGLVLSKMDSDAKGGAALSIRYVTGVPIRYISLGEKVKDLELFHPDRLAQRILDMGDVLTLVEKAQEVIDQKEAEKQMKRMEKGQFTLKDFLSQMEMFSKLGSMEGILKMIPGMGGMVRQLGDLSMAENEMKKIKVIISSMTNEERENHQLLNSGKSKSSASRINRISKGSGTTPADVNAFITKFNQMQKMMGPMMQMMKGGGGGLGSLLGGLGGGFPGMGGMDDNAGPQNGFRQSPGQSGKNKIKGKKGSPYGRRFF